MQNEVRLPKLYANSRYTVISIFYSSHMRFVLRHI